MTQDVKISKEAYAYTPGLKVQRSTTVVKTRRLPVSGKVFVKEGEKVHFDSLIAGTQVEGNPEIVNVAAFFNIEPPNIVYYMIKKLNDEVKKGEVIAKYRSFFGLVKRDMFSPVEGKIEAISKLTGQVIVRGSPVPVNISAYIPGVVTKILPNEGAVIETNAAFIQGIFGIGGETHGKIRIAVDSEKDVLNDDAISIEDKGTILVGGSLVTLNALRKAVEVGASAIISGGIDYDDLKKFIGTEVGVIITGEEEMGLTLIVTEGLGQMPMASRTFGLLKHFEGYMASINGVTQIRAGVIRPEIIIHHNEGLEATTLKEELVSGMVPGTLVRIIRDPYFGVIGKVYSLPVELQSMESESEVRIVDIKLDNGKIVKVPRANVEMIEE